MWRSTVFFVLSLYAVKNGLAQTLPQSTDLKQIVTPSPTASALGQYGNTPVGLYSGSAQVTVPLYEIKEGALSLPITLSYNSSGNKVADMASWTGLGFSLNAGGCISRTVYGLPDENNWMNPSFHLPSSPTAGQTKNALMNQVDYQPDVFYFNFNGKSGKFILNNTSTISTSPHQNLKIQAVLGDSALNPPFYGFIPLVFRITDENGIVYEFKDNETNRTLSYNPDLGQDPNLHAPGVPPASTTAWYLTDMYSPTGDTIRFFYGDYPLLYDLPSSEQQFVFQSANTFNAADLPTQAQYVKNVVRSENANKRLQQIQFSNGSVVFTARQPRQDLIGDTTLNQMMVLNKNRMPIKGWSFNYMYSYPGNGSLFVDTTAPSPSNDNFYSSYISNISTTSYYRLMLTSVAELDNKYNADGRIYSFDYDLNHSVLPSRFSTKRDYWGYFNGNDYSQNTFLSYQLTGPNTDPNSYLITGKEPDSNYCRGNSLSRITYPTGGYTQFNYELHNAFVGRGVLPPLVSEQTVTMAIDFLGYPSVFSDTTISGLDCVYKNFTFSADTGASANIVISNILFQNGIHPLLRFDIFDSANQPYLSMQDIEGNAATTTTFVQINPTTRAYSYSINSVHFSKGTYKVIFYPIASYIGNSTYLTTYLAQPVFTITGWSNLTYNTDTVNISRNIGGLRIRSTIDYDPVANKILEKDYNYNLIDSSLSSGTLASGASYIYPLTEFISNTFSTDGGTITASAYYHYVVLNAESNYPLSTTQGSFVGYSTVTEKDIDAATGIPNGKSEYHYTSPKDFPDYYGSAPGPADNFPFPPPDARDWQRGLLLKRIDYEYTGGQYLPLKIENDTYSSPIFVDTVIGYSGRYLTEVFPAIADTSAVVTINGGNPELNPETFAGDLYYLTGGYVKLLNKSTTLIQNGDSITETSNYAYADAPSNLLPTAITSVDSKGNTNTTHLTYPFDYSVATPATSQSQGLLTLQQHHMLNPVVEKTVRKTSAGGSDLGVISGIYSTFKPSQTLPDTIFRLQSASPVVGYTPVSVTNTGTTMNSSYAPYISFGLYDNFGNLLQQQKVSDLSQAYLWDYHAKFPIAQVKNAVPGDIAYTSFEADGTGNWTIGTGTVDSTRSITGRNSYNLTSGTISKSGLNSPTTYIVSYWSQNGAYSIPGTISGYPVTGKTVSFNNPGWTLYVHKVTGQSTVTLSGSGHIDELRLYPATSQMTTYTYNPVIGMTSQTDAGNRVTYYEYDGLQRLKRIRDQDYNILKSLEYQYQTSSGCGGNCFSIPMQTLGGSNTLSYPVGVFSINGKLLGNAATSDSFVAKWNRDTGDIRIGTLAKGKDSMHFNLTVNTGQTMPAGVTGCRYYQYDLAFNILDGITCGNGAYVDWGDGIGMRIPLTYVDTPAVMPPNTQPYGFFSRFDQSWWFVHTYPDSSLKTITIYHNDDAKASDLDNGHSPATSLTKVQNLRGNIPQQSTAIGGSCYQQASALTVANITNWNTITSITGFWPHCGDKTTGCEHLSYAQDFMANNRGLNDIEMSQGGYYESGVCDSTFKVSRLKSDWNTYFTQIHTVVLEEDNWNHEDLSHLPNLSLFAINAATQNHTNDPTGNPVIPLASSVSDSVVNQIARGSGQTISNGAIALWTYGGGVTSACRTSMNFLINKGWAIYVDGVLQTVQ